MGKTNSTVLVKGGGGKPQRFWDYKIVTTSEEFNKLINEGYIQSNQKIEVIS